MKKWMRSITIVICTISLCLFFAIPARADEMSVSVDEVVAQGDSVAVTVTFTGSNLSYGLVEISCDGAVNGSLTETIGDDTSFSNTLSDTFYVGTNGTGTGTIYVSGYFCYLDKDGAPHDSEYYSQSYTLTVTDSSDGESAPGRGAGADDNYSYGDGTYINGKPIGEGSGNAAISYIRLLGSERKEITLNDDGHGIYSATVLNSVEKVTIEAGAEDEKASVSGTGEKELAIGLNTFDIVVTAENGLQMGYQINITRMEEQTTLSETKEEVKTSKEEPAKTKKSPWLIIVIIVVVLLAAVLVFILLRNRKNKPKGPGDHGQSGGNPEHELEDDVATEVKEKNSDQGGIATKDIKIDPYYAVTDISSEIGEKVRTASDLSETQILLFEDMEHQPESETTILRYEDMDHNPETETTILRYEDMNHTAETETTILNFEEIDKRLNDE